MLGQILNPHLAKSILVDAQKQLAWRIPKLAPKLSKINPQTIKSWGDLAAKMSRAVGHNKTALRDIISHVSTRYKMSLDPNFSKILKGKEFVKASKGMAPKVANKFSGDVGKYSGTKASEAIRKSIHQQFRNASRHGAKIKPAAAKTAGLAKPAVVTKAGAIGAGLGIGLVGGAAALGAGAIGHQWWKHKKEVERGTREQGQRHEVLMKAIRARRPKTRSLRMAQPIPSLRHNRLRALPHRRRLPAENRYMPL